MRSATARVGGRVKLGECRLISVSCGEPDEAVLGLESAELADHFVGVEALIAEIQLIGQYETESPPAPRLGARREPRFTRSAAADMR